MGLKCNFSSLTYRDSNWNVDSYPYSRPTNAYVPVWFWYRLFKDCTLTGFQPGFSITLNNAFLTSPPLSHLRKYNDSLFYCLLNQAKAPLPDIWGSPSQGLACLLDTPSYYSAMRTSMIISLFSDPTTHASLHCRIRD